MDRERRDLFEPAARSLPALTKQTLARAFVDFDAKRRDSLAVVHANAAALLHKYGVASKLPAV